jgi:hypothetical protein
MRAKPPPPRASLHATLSHHPPHSRHKGSSGNDGGARRVAKQSTTINEITVSLSKKKINYRKQV